MPPSLRHASTSAHIHPLGCAPPTCNTLDCAQVVIFVFCLLGMEFFGGALDPSARTKFDNLYWAFLAVFQIITAENINTVVGAPLGRPSRR
jgi:hypothetical protein